MKGNTLQTLCSSALRSLKRNSPTILTIGAIIGLGFTSVTVATGTLKAQKRLEKAKEEKFKIYKSLGIMAGFLFVIVLW